MLDARPGFIIKILKRSLIDKFIITRAFDCQYADWKSKTADWKSKTADWQSKARVIINLSIRERFRIFSG